MGGGGGGNKGVKILLTVGFAALGGILGAAPGGFTVTQGIIYGASLASTIWSVVNKPKGPQEQSSGFDVKMNTINPGGTIPIVYGSAKIGGLQSYHFRDSDGKGLTKDIILCEGQIAGVYGVTANNLLIQAGTVFKIYNDKHEDAYVQVFKTNSPTPEDKVLRLYAGGQLRDIPLQHPNDLAGDQSNDFSCDMGKLISYINGYGFVNDIAALGWKTTESADVSISPEQIYDVGRTNAYNNPVALSTKGLPDCSYTFSDGTTPPNNFIKVGGYKNVAWLRASLRHSDDLQSAGNPVVNAIVRGRMITDTRTGKYEYSENPAMCVRDYLLNRRFGCGYFITEDMLDEESFKEVADHCDELVSYKTTSGAILKEKRYTLNIVMHGRKKHIDNLGDMFACFGAFLAISNNKISLRCEKAVQPSYNFNDDNIVMGSVSFNQTSLADTPNRYTIGYIDPNYNYTEVKVVMDDIADQTERQQVITKDVSLNGCNRQTQAKRLGRLYKAINRLCGVMMNFQTSTMAMHLEPGDVITITYKNLFTNQPARILEIHEEKGLWTIKAQQYNASIYNDNYMATIENKNYSNIGNPFSDVIPNVYNMKLEQEYYVQSDGGKVSNILVSYNLPNYEFFRSVNFFISTDKLTWSGIGSTFGDKFIINNAVVGTVYYVKAVVQNSVGRYSSGVIVRIEITGYDVLPPNVSGLDLEVLANGTSRYWWNFEYPEPNDIAGFRLKYIQGPNLNWETALPLHTGLITTQPFYDTVLRTGQHTVMIKAVDNSGQESDIPARVLVNMGETLQENVLFQLDFAQNSWGEVTHTGIVDSFNYLRSESSDAMWQDKASPMWGDLQSPMWVQEFAGFTANMQLTALASGQFWLEYDISGPFILQYMVTREETFWEEDSEPFWNYDGEAFWGSGDKELVWRNYSDKSIVKAGDLIKIRILTSRASREITVKKLKAYIDVPDKTENFNNLAVPENGLLLPIKTPNYYTTAVRINAIQGDDNNILFPEIVSRQPCLIKIRDVEGNYVSATVDVSWQGFIKELI